MTRKKDPNPPRGPELRALDPVESVEEFLAGLGEDADRVVVYRYNDLDSRQEYCGSLPWPAVDIPDEIRKRWGGGRFSVRLHGPPNKENKSGYIGFKQLSIVGPAKDLSRTVEPEADTERDRRRAEEAEQRVAELEGLRREDRIVAALAELKDFVADLRNPPAAAADANTFRMVLELVKEMQARVVPHVETPVRDGSEMLGLVKILLEMVRDSGGGGGGPYDHVIDRVGVPLLRILEQRIGTPAQIPAETGEPNPPVTDLRGVLAQFVPYLVTWAEQGKDPGIRADVIADEIPPGWHDALAEIVLDGSALTRLIGWFPELGPHRPWIEKLVHGLRENLSPAGETEEEEEEDAGAELGVLTELPEN